jgi:DNA repair exonuclease SbcCD ATPase subunit
MNIDDYSVRHKMRLKSLALKNFRAFSNTEQPAIDLAHSVILFCGKNGAGKTSLFEALELFLTGSVERLAGIETIGQVLVNVREPDAPARLTLEWAHNGADGATSAEINRNQKTFQVKPALDSEQINSFRNTTYLPQATMRRVISSGPLKLGEIIKILAMSQKSEVLLDGIAQAGITRRDAGFQNMTEAYARKQKSLSDAEVRIKSLKDSIQAVAVAAGGLASWFDDINYISMQLEPPVAQPTHESLETLDEQIKTVDSVLQSKLADAMQVKAEGERAKVRCQRLREQEEDRRASANVFAENESLSVKLETELKSLDDQLKRAQDELTDLESGGIAEKRLPAMLKLLIDARDQSDSNICPVCDQPLENLREHIERKLQNLTAEQSEYDNRLSLARTNLKQIQDSRRQKIKDLAEIKHVIQDHKDEEQSLLSNIKVFLGNYDETIGVGCSLQQVYAYEQDRISKAEKTIHQLTGLADKVSRLRSEISASSTRASQLMAELVEMERQQTNLAGILAEAKAAKERVDDWIEAIQAVHTVLSNQLEESLGTYANQYISRQFADLFERICGHPYWKVTLPQVRVRYHKAEAEWKAAYRGKTYSGEAVFSQGEVNACALAMFLALATAQTSHPGLLLLDDPIQNMDEIRIEDFAQVLKSLKDDLGWQLVIAVHEESVFDYLKRQLYPSSQGQSLVSYKLVSSDQGTIASEKDALVFDTQDFFVQA